MIQKTHFFLEGESPTLRMNYEKLVTAPINGK